MATESVGMVRFSEIWESACRKAKEYDDIGFQMKRLTRKLIDSGMTLPQIRTIFERHSLAAALDEQKQNVCATARKHGLHRNTLVRQKRELGLKFPIVGGGDQ